MRIDTVRGERSLAELANRLFQIKGGREPGQVEQAVAALRRANPHLKPRAAPRDGTPILVPDVAGLDRAASPGVAAPLTQDVATRLRDALGQMGKTLEADLGRELDSEKEAAQQLKPHKRELSATDEHVRVQLATIEAAAGLRRKELTEAQQLQKASLTALEEDLVALIDAVSRANDDDDVPPG